MMHCLVQVGDGSNDMLMTVMSLQCIGRPGQCPCDSQALIPLVKLDFADEGFHLRICHHSSSLEASPSTCSLPLSSHE